MFSRDVIDGLIRIIRGLRCEAKIEGKSWNVPKQILMAGCWVVLNFQGIELHCEVGFTFAFQDDGPGY